MNVLIPVTGTEDEIFFRQAVALTGLERADGIILAHVVDSGPRADLEFGRERYLGRRPLPDRRTVALSRAEDDRAREGIAFARQALQDAGVPPGVIREVVLRGKPNEALRDLADGERIDLIVVRARPGKPGPHSLGKTARFLVDHAPGAALLIRPAAAPGIPA